MRVYVGISLLIFSSKGAMLRALDDIIGKQVQEILALADALRSRGLYSAPRSAPKKVTHPRDLDATVEWQVREILRLTKAGQAAGDQAAGGQAGGGTTAIIIILIVVVLVVTALCCLLRRG